ncbi:sensor histidine kinase [Sandaracinus amylolyticus]|uniref:histidine kinase n=1 Tax=Sandaracinus amylolyticus TaxID=927083 RepID=A0A0F6YLG2_9BACT|nr:HAMP domain-containing sensor histidine kinase [Sandaracinus amylolyticus]AKF09851.1 Sensory box histidine kinase [Sandaracinus amylolyticus]
MAARDRDRGSIESGSAPLAEIERRVLSCARLLLVTLWAPILTLGSVQAWLGGTLSIWAVLGTTLSYAVALTLFVLRRAPVRLQATLFCAGGTLVSWCSLLHAGPLLGVGLAMAATRTSWTIFFGRRGLVASVAAMLVVFALTAWASLEGISDIAERSPSAPRTAGVWLRLWLAMAAGLAFVGTLVHIVLEGHRTMVQRALASEQRIKEQSAELARTLDAETHARRAAEDATRVRDEFLTLASHELRTPLTSLKLGTQVLRRTSDGPHVERMDRQIRRLERLVASLLDTTQLASASVPLERADVDLAALVTEVVAKLDAERARSGSVVTVHAAGPVIGRWDRLGLDQVLTSLLENAIKFGAGRPIDVDVEPDGDAARIEVRDRGIGMSPEVLEHAFERFYRGVSWTKYGGLGLGLYVAHQIVATHGGTLTASSETGVGTALTIVLPTCIPPAPRRESARADVGVLSPRVAR